MNERPLWLVASLVATALLGCGKKSSPGTSTTGASWASPGAPAAVAPPADAPVVRQDPRWRPSTAPCTVAMSAPPAPKRGENLGNLALQQGLGPGQINRTTVSAFPETWTPGGGDGVPVLYVETSGTAPVLDATSQTFTAGSSEGTAYIFDRRTGTVACMARVRATSSDAVTSLGPSDTSAVMWLTIDLDFAVERAIAANARAITTGADGAPTADAGARAKVRPRH